MLRERANDEAMPDYNEHEICDLQKQIAGEPLERPVGRAICPFCRHREARWRKSPDPGGGVEIRVLCSQCQRLCRYFSPDRGLGRPLV